MYRVMSACALALVVAGAVHADERFQVRQQFGQTRGSVHHADGSQSDVEDLTFEGEVEIFRGVADQNGNTNPLYESQQHESTNPLYGGGDRGGLVSMIRSLSYERGPITAETLPRDNIVHRDIAARNMLLATDFGMFRAQDGEEFFFESLAPQDYIGDGPVTWSIAGAVRLYLDGDPTSGSFIEFGEGLSFTETIVPAPGAAALFGIAGAAAWRRRR